MAESRKGHNFARLGPTDNKKYGFSYFFELMQHINFQVPNFSGSLNIVRHLIFTKRVITLAIFNALPLKVNQHIFIR